MRLCFFGGIFYALFCAHKSRDSERGGGGEEERGQEQWMVMAMGKEGAVRAVVSIVGAMEAEREGAMPGATCTGCTVGRYTVNVSSSSRYRVDG